MLKGHLDNLKVTRHGCEVQCGPVALAFQQFARGGLVRSVTLGADFVVSGSHGFGVRVWDRRSVGRAKFCLFILRFIDTKGLVFQRRPQENS